MDAANIVPIDFVKYALRHWGWLVIGALLGALCGLGVQAVLPPVYQAQAQFSVSIDFAHTGLLTDVEEDIMIDGVGDVLESDVVVEKTTRLAADQNLPFDLPEFLQARDLQRRNQDWLLIIRQREPQRAAGLANAWADAADAVLQDAFLHTLKAEMLQKYIDSLVSCLEGVSVDPAPAGCSSQGIAWLQSEIDQTGALLQAEKTASLGMVPGTQAVFSKAAQVPDKPIAAGRNTLVLAGASIGYLAALWLIAIRCPDRLPWRKGHQP